MGNALRHGRATDVRLTLDVDRSTATLEVVDDGTGFDAEAAARAPGPGLFTMRERVELVGGRCAITSRHGAGTRVATTVPLG